ncbi:MAG TPA: hypothetical protein VLB11_11950 [Methyloceanibacter sp.]|nr:hypothetical protein [Methyloceanibacter sp.]
MKTANSEKGLVKTRIAIAEARLSRLATQNLIARSRHSLAERIVTSVGLVGDRINIPLFPLVAANTPYHGSFWGNYNDLNEVVNLVQQGKIRHTVKPIRFEEINENLDLLRTGDVVGRAVIKY